MNDDQEERHGEKQPRKKLRLFGCDPAPLMVLAVFVLLIMQFFPEMRLWVLVLIACGVLLHLVVAYFRNRN